MKKKKFSFSAAVLQLSFESALIAPGPPSLGLDPAPGRQLRQELFGGQRRKSSSGRKLDDLFNKKGPT
jgi:hypothetical protein